MSEYISDILIHKKGDLLDVYDSHLEFSPYITQRYLSACSPQVCNILNHTTNNKLKFLDKRQLYKLWIQIIPKNESFIVLPKRKPKVQLNELEQKAVDFLAQKHKISKREVQEYIKEMKIDIGEIIKIFK